MRVCNIGKLFVFMLLSTQIVFGQFVDTIPPNVEFLIPGNGGYFSCPMGQIILKITDESPIDTESSFLTASIRMFLYDLPESVTSPLDSIYRFSIPVPLMDGDSVFLLYAPICDMLHNCRTLNMYFWADFTPPEIEFITLPGVLPWRAFDNIMIRTLDALAGVSPDSSWVTITVRGQDSWTTTLSFASSMVFWSGETLLVDINSLGVLKGGDTVSLCVSAADRAVGCGANRTDSCVTYYLLFTPPRIIPVFPQQGQIIACPDSVSFDIMDVDSIVSFSVIINGETVAVDETVFTSSGLHAMLRLDSLPDGIYNTIAVYAEDIYANVSETTWGFWTDLSPPYVVDVVPRDGELITDTVTTFHIRLWDELSGVDWGSVSLTVNSVSTPFTINPTTSEITFNHVFSTMPGTLDSERVRICIRASDAPDFCVNVLDTCFRVKIYVDTRQPSVIPPPEVVTACRDQIILVTVTSRSGLDSATVSLTISSNLRATPDVVHLDSPFFWMTTHSTIFEVVDTLIFAPSLGYWQDGETLWCQFHGLTHTSDVAASDWIFYTDFSPPVFAPISPVLRSITSSLPETVFFWLYDSISGINRIGFAGTLFVNGAPYEIPFSVLHRDRYDTFAYSLALSDIGVSLSACDSVRIKIRCPDNVSTEYCGPNVLDTSLFWFSVDCSPPAAVLIEPLLYEKVSCENQRIAFLLNHDSNLDSSSICVAFAHDTFCWGSPRLSMHGDTLVYTNPAPFTDGDTVEGVLLPMRDAVGNRSFPVPFSFVIDLSPPRITPISPLPASVIPDTLANIVLRITDMSGVAEAWLSSPFGRILSRTADTFYYDHSSWGTSFGAEETVFCVVWAEDSASRCGRNRDTINYWFIVDAIGPILTSFDTVFGGFTSCSGRSIGFIFRDFTGLNRWHIEVLGSHEPDTLDFLSPQLAITESSITYTPSSPYSDGETVRVEILSAPDIAGNEFMDDSIVVSFIVDLSDPIIMPLSYTDGETIYTLTPDIAFWLYDSISGINWSSCSLFVQTSSFAGTLTTSDASVSRAGDTIRLNTRILGIGLVGGDSIRVCIKAMDNVLDTMYGCPPHVTESCVTLYIEPTPPVATLLSPFDSAIVSCHDFPIVIEIIDTPGVDWDTLVLSLNGVLYNQSSPSISHPAGTDSLVFSGYIPFEDGTLRVCLIYARDILGNELGSPLCWYFRLDTLPPSIVAQSPAPGLRTSNVTPSFISTFFDSITDTVVVDSFAIDGVWRVGGSWDFWNGESLVFSPTVALGVGVHTVCVAVRDVPDYCPPNDTIICWSFTISLAPPNVWVVFPDSLPVACNPVLVEVGYFDIDSISYLRLIVPGVDSIDFDSTVFVGDSILFYYSLWTDSIFANFAGVIVAADTLGNVDTIAINFVVDRNPPDVRIIVPADYETVFTRTPDIVSICVDSSGISLDSLFLIVNGDVVPHSSITPRIEGETLTVSLSSVPYLLPERGYSTIHLVGIADMVPEDAYHCGPNFAPEESVVVYIPDDDTVGPYISPPSIDWGYCGYRILPCWQIFDSSGVDSVYLIKSISSSFEHAETMLVINSYDSIFCPMDSIMLDSDSMFVVVCALDADSETGYGDDRALSCSDTFVIICRRVRVNVFPDSLSFGEVCLGDSARKAVFVVNPLEVPVDVSLEIFGSSAFEISMGAFTIFPHDTAGVDIAFKPTDTIDYNGNLLVRFADTSIEVSLKGTGVLCPEKFSAEPRVITPNDDGYYDFVVFTFPSRKANKVEIFTTDFEHVATIQRDNVVIVWHGEDKSGRKCPAGAYIFLAFSDGKLLGKGIITVVR